MNKQPRIIDTYNEIASFYDLFNDRNPQEDITHLRQVFCDYGLDFEESCIIEVGAGTGRVTIPLSKVVHEVIHVEPAKNMLEVAVTKSIKEKRQNITFIHARWEDLADHNVHCNAVIAMDKVFHYLHDKKAQYKALQSSFNLLKDKGIIVLDLFYFPGLIFMEKPSMNTDIKQSQKTIIRQSQHHVDMRNDLFILEDTYFVLDENEYFESMIHNEHAFSIITKREIVGLLETVGFHNVTIYEIEKEEGSSLRFFAIGQKV